MRKRERELVIVSKKEETDSPQAFAVTHNLHSMTLAQIQDAMAKDCFTHYIRKTQSHTYLHVPTRTPKHTNADTNQSVLSISHSLSLSSVIRFGEISPFW